MSVPSQDVGPFETPPYIDDQGPEDAATSIARQTVNGGYIHVSVFPSSRHANLVSLFRDCYSHRMTAIWGWGM